MPLAGKVAQDMTFVDMLFVIVLGWILVALWQRCIDNFTYNSLRLDKDSTYHTFIIAIVATIIFLVFTFIFDSILGGIVESDIEGGFSPPSNTSPIVGTPSTTTSLSLPSCGCVLIDR